MGNVGEMRMKKLTQRKIRNEQKQHSMIQSEIFLGFHFMFSQRALR